MVHQGFNKLLKVSFLCISALLSIVNSHACGNEFGYNAHGHRIYTRYFYLTDGMKSFDTDELELKMSETLTKLEQDPDNYKLKSNLALYKMKLGHANEALSILKPLATEYPDNYTIIANLGTAYELTYQLDSALKYISKGYEINPNSHFKSEWVHIEILKAKIKRKTDPDYILNNPILSKELLESKVRKNSRAPLIDINAQVFYQIRTRVPFTPAPNEVITNLLVSMAELCAEKETLETALLLYAYALEFNQKKNLKIKNNIHSAILKLNRLRSQIPNYKVPHELISVVKRAELSPEFLYNGLETVAEKLDSADEQVFLFMDTLADLRQQLDTLNHQLDHSNNVLDSLQTNATLQTSTPKDSGKENKAFQFVLAVLVGILIGFGARFLSGKRSNGN